MEVTPPPAQDQVQINLEQDQSFENPDREREHDTAYDWKNFGNWDESFEDNDNGPTGHGDECYSDADPGL